MEALIEKYRLAITAAVVAAVANIDKVVSNLPQDADNWLAIGIAAVLVVRSYLKK